MAVSQAGIHEPGINRRILVVEDEAPIREVVMQYLTAAGFSVIEAADGLAALHILTTQPVDLVVLDLLLPKLDGRELCRRIRATSAIPIIMLTAISDEADTLRGFALGADDYVTKPFSPREVVVRVQAIMRRVDATTTPAMLHESSILSAGLVIHPELRRVERGGAVIEMTAKEFDLLLFLVHNPNQVFTRQQLLNQVWGFDYFGDASTVTVHIRRLREKVEPDAAHPRHIKTVWSVGYRYEP